MKSKLLSTLRWATGVCALLFVCGVALIATALHLLRPGPGEWSAPVRLGPWRGELSGPALLRIATHPVVLEHLQNRAWITPFGPVTLHAGSAPDRWRGVCSPCEMQIDSLGREPVRLQRIEFDWRRDVRMDLFGEFVLVHARSAGADPDRAVRGAWSVRNGVEQVEVSLRLHDTPLAHAFGLFADRLPELARARIDGRLGVDVHWQWPSRALTVKPRLDGFVVAGLGTEALLDALPSCAAAPGPAGYGTWLPRAVLATEDQRFFEHAGYDLVELGAAFSSEPRSGATRRGASTLSQQLAKLIYTGDQPSHLRKLRELLYAVELDRTLGKARVLNLYLALAPWGAGQCGATAAAARYLAQSAYELDPLDAAWLASLLHNPDAELAQMARSGQPHRIRVRWIVEHLRPLNRARRRVLLDTLDDWAPPPQAFEAAAAAHGVRVAGALSP